MPEKSVLSEFSKISPGRTLLVISKEFPEEAFLASVKFLTSREGGGNDAIILSMKRTHEEMLEELSANEIDLEKISIIDATGRTKTPKNGSGRIVSIKSPGKIVTIALSLTGATRSIAEGRAILMIDSATEIFLHSDRELFREFSAHFSFLTKSSGARAIVFSSEPHKEFLEISERTVQI